MMDSSNPAAHEKFLTAPMLAALVSGVLLLAWPYLAMTEFGPGGSQNGFQWLFPHGTRRRIMNTAGW